MSNNPRPFMWNKTGPFCNVAFTARGSDYLALIPRDMSVDESLHDYYFAARNSYVMALEAFGAHGIAPTPYALVETNGAMVGAGTFDPDEDADSMAWKACWFVETYGLQIAIVTPEGVPHD